MFRRQLAWIGIYGQQSLQSSMTPTAVKARGNQDSPVLLRLCVNSIPYRFELERKKMEDHRVFRQQMQNVQATAGSGQALACRQRQFWPRETWSR